MAEGLTARDQSRDYKKKKKNFKILKIGNKILKNSRSKLNKFL